MSLTLDPDADGRQHGFLVLDDGGAGAPFDTRRVPLSSLHRGAGPRIVLIAGLDGGDTLGALALQRLARELEPDRLAGNVLIVPAADPSALGLAPDRGPGIARTLDGIFPGRPDGDIGERLAAALRRHVIARADLVLELRPAGTGFAFAPMAAVAKRAGACPDSAAPDAERARCRAEAAMIAFGAPESVRLGRGAGCGTLAVTLAGTTAHVQATPGGDAPQASALALAADGCRNVLVAAGVLDAPFTLRATRLLELDGTDAFVHAPANGLLELHARPGQDVYRGNALATIVDPERSAAAPLVLSAPRDGVVLAARRDGRARSGDCIAAIADEVQR